MRPIAGRRRERPGTGARDHPRRGGSSRILPIRTEADRVDRTTVMGTVFLDSIDTQTGLTANHPLHFAGTRVDKGDVSSGIEATFDSE